MTFRGLPRPVQRYVTAWILTATTVVSWSLTRQHHLAVGDWGDLAILTACAVGYDELSRRVEAARRGLAQVPT